VRAKKVSVFLADLRHNSQGALSTDSMPLNVGNIKAVLDRDLPEVSSRVFVYPDRLLEAMRESPPDAIMFSNYIWNEPLDLHFARMAKQFNPNALTVMGGPNFFIEDDRKADYMQRNRCLDIYVAGEGDFTALEIMKLYLASDCDPEKTRLNDIENSVYLRGDSCHIGPAVPRRRDLDSIPSPWLTGVMDEFFDGKLVPLFETNRGCPFTCTFCVQGGKWWSKVNYFSMDRIKEEIYYIARKIREKSPNQKVLRLADLNYGMYERDVQISEWMGEVQKEYDWPLLIDATTGKNQAERIIRSIEKVNGALVMYQAVQSLDEDVLLIAKRKNISVETYAQVQMHIRGRGLRSSSDLILGLPGETLQTHLNSVKTLINSGTHKLNNFQAMLLKGSELETKALRERHGYTTRFRLLPRNFGRYGGEKILGFEEIIVSTNTLSFEDYLEARRYHFAISAFWNASRFDKLVQWVQAFGLSGWDWMNAVVQELDDHEGTRELCKKFLKETTGELFETRAQAEAFYMNDENFAALERAEFGDNLIYKYSALASFLEWPAICACAIAAAKKIIGTQVADANGADADIFWDDLNAWLVLSYIHGQTRESILRSNVAWLHYDIAAWLAAGCPRDVTAFRLSSPVKTEFTLSAENAKNIEAALQVWDYDLKSFSMLVKRMHNSWHAREMTAVPEAVPTV